MLLVGFSSLVNYADVLFADYIAILFLAAETSQASQASNINTPAAPANPNPNNSQDEQQQQQQPSATSPPVGDTEMTSESANDARQSQLSMIAASANEMVPQGNPPVEQESIPDGLPRTGESWNPSLTSQEQLLFNSLQEHDPSLTATAATQRAASYPRPIAMNPNTQAKGFVNKFGNTTKPAKPKVRGRFSAARRREVQEVRKRGACIRCRMLKKPVRLCRCCLVCFI